MVPDDRYPRLHNLVESIAVFECRLAGRLPMENNYKARQITEFYLNHAYRRLNGYVMAVLDRASAGAANV